VTDPRDELARLAAATRGALEWHQETGAVAVDVGGEYAMPDFATAPEGSAVPGTPPPVPPEVHQPAALPPEMPREPAVSEAAFAALRSALHSGTADSPPPAVTRPAEPVMKKSPAEVSKSAQLPTGGTSKADALERLREEICDFDREPLSAGATELVFGSGNPDARLMMIGEAPGPVEDEIGLPFVDEAGRLLGRMIRAMGLRRNDVYLTYLVKCRTPGRHPEAWLDVYSEVLARQVAIIQPEVIIALGDLAARRLTGREEAFPRLRGQWFDYQGVATIPTFHPVALLQNPRSKALVWSDLQSVMRRMGLKQPQRN